EQKEFPLASRGGVLALVASPDGRDGSLRMHQDASVYASVLGKGKEVRHPLAPGRHAWVQVARGEVAVNGTGGTRLAAGDGGANALSISCVPRRRRRRTVLARGRRARFGGRDGGVPARASAACKPRLRSGGSPPPPGATRAPSPRRSSQRVRRVVLDQVPLDH